uniref:Major facilitator superfamily MFS_1 n=1 Tax=Sphingomonas sp. NS2 TaxID=908605 RepID=A0A0D4ZZH4_9SPHN|nr:major facilitator superfamily MFS_1 [Sphingomonas sp. NS2]
MVFGAFVTTSASAIAVMSYSFAAMAPDIQREFGWGRGYASLAITMLSFGTFIACTGGGKVADKFGTMIVSIVSAILCGLVVTGMPWIINSIFTFCICYAFIGILGVGMLPVTLLRPIGRLFNTRRGLATGAVLSGTGVSAIFIPFMTNALVERGGWHLAYIGLSLLIFCNIPVLWLSLRHYAREERLVLHHVALSQWGCVTQGLTLKEARRTATLWKLTAVALLAGTCFAGIVVHLMLAYRDMGASPAHASTLLAVIGFSAIVGRLFTGMLLDRINGPKLGFLVLLMASGGFAVTLAFGLDGAFLGAVLIGLGYGSEYDIIAYFVGRYFGVLEFGAIYGWLYGFLALGNSIGPLLVGMSYDYGGNYYFALGVATSLICIAAGVTLALGEYRYAVSEPS